MWSELTVTAANFTGLIINVPPSQIMNTTIMTRTFLALLHPSMPSNKRKIWSVSKFIEDRDDAVLPICAVWRRRRMLM